MAESKPKSKSMPVPVPVPDQRALIYIEEMRNISEIANEQQYLCDSTWH